jgi:NADH dehydrogenase FAD-containing subunit
VRSHQDLVHGNNRLLEFLSEKASLLAKKQLESLGVEVILNERLERLDEHQFKSISNQTIYNADIFYNCVGSIANTSFLVNEFKSSLNERGLIRVDEYFKVLNTDNMYAIGDCVDIPEPKLGLLAINHGLILAKNLTKLSVGQSFEKYTTKKPMVMVPIGREKGVLQLPIGILTNKALIRIKTKDFFVKKYSKLLGIT